jgi:hypothetical protein
MKTLFLFPTLLASFALISLKAVDLPKVLIMGDSISMGYTSHVIENLKGVAEVKRHKGNAGPTIRGVAKIEEWLGDGKWDLIHFNWGLWDMYGWEYHKDDRSPEVYGKRLESLVGRLKKTRAKLIWATTTPACPGKEVTMERRFKQDIRISPALERKYLEAALGVMKKNGVQVNDLHAFMKPQWAKYAIADNNVHFKPEGKKALGKKVSDCIINALKADLPANQGSWEALFDGKSLDGWTPRPGGNWEVKDGAILGTSPKSERRHGILLSNREFSDFVIQAKFRVQQGDSGFYFRSGKVKSAVSVNGFQVEIDTSQETGGLYETGGRAWVNKPSKQAIAERKYEKGKWAELELRAVGRDVTVKINGVVCSDLKNDKGRTKGYFGLQLHGGQEMRVEYTDIRIKEL